jgi:hypothetical protein
MPVFTTSYAVSAGLKRAETTETRGGRFFARNPETSRESARKYEELQQVTVFQAR